MSEKRVVRLYYGFQLCFGMLLWVPIFYDYQKKVGLADAEIFRIQSIYYLAFCALEIPTGFLADRWGHRICMTAGAAVLTGANLLPLLAPGYAGFLAHFLLIALSRSLISGASSAYLYDFLKGHGRAGEYKRIEGAARSWSLVGKVVCWAAVGSLMQWHLSLPYWITCAFSAASLAFAVGLPSLGIAPGRESGARGELLRQLRPVAGILARSPALVLVMVQGIAIFVLARIASVNLFQPVLSAKGFELPSYGLVMSALTLFEAVGSAYPGAMRRWFSDLGAVYALTVAMGASLAALAWVGPWGTLAWFCAFSLAAGLSFPIQRQLLNDSIPDSRFRATLLSVESLADRAVCAWVASVVGGFVGAGRVGDFLVLSGAISVASVAVIWAVARWRGVGQGIEAHAP